MNRSDKLYILVRNDLKLGLQAAQSAHAIAELIFKYPSESSTWNKKSNYIIILSVKDENELHSFARKLKMAGTKLSIFLEPDLNMEATALAVLPGEMVAEILKELPLAMKDKTCPQKMQLDY